MRLCITVLTVTTLAVQIGTAQSDPGFSGLWKLNSARSDVHNLPTPPEPVLKVEQTAKALTLHTGSDEAGPFTLATYPLDGSPAKRQVGGSSLNTVTKWEGAALLVNTIVSGPQNYTVMERWKRSRDGSTLTIKRTIVRLGGESESLLVYENPAAAALAAAKQPEPAPIAVATPRIIQRAPQMPDTSSSPSEYVVEAGTRVLLRLTNAVNTKHTAAGDRLYLETAVPVFVNGRLIIPRGSYVTGTVIDAKRAGRVKGKSELNLRFDSLTLPNGVTRDLRALPSAADTQGSLDKKEGKIEGEGNKGGDAKTVGRTTAAGAGIGTLAGAAAGHAGMGAGIGAAAGAAAGLAGVFGSRGPDVVLPPGTTVELMLDRDLRYTAAELR
jgi:type IV secretion system protein VirB10